MKKAFLAFTLLAGLVACQADSPVEPLAQQLQFSSSPTGLSPLEQSMVDAVMAGEDPGAVIARNDVCAFSPGFFNDGVFVGFGGLFPTPGPQGICPLSNFERTNPDGTVDLHLQGSGGFFLLVFEPSFQFFSSEGSHVRWRLISHEGGTTVFTVSGTLSNGSRVRAHFVTDPSGDNKAANTLWVEGLGYVVGGPPGRNR